MIVLPDRPDPEWVDYRDDDEADAASGHGEACPCEDCDPLGRHDPHSRWGAL